MRPRLISDVILIATMLLITQRCDTEELPEGTPECVRQKIDYMSRHWNPPGEVYSYFYEGRKVYYIIGRCCDFFNELYDEDCHRLCAPSGGFGGGGDGKCPDFFSSATDRKLVWKDEQEHP